MKRPYGRVVCGGVDVHRKFSKVTFRDAQGNVVARERLDHPDRRALRRQLLRWPKGLPMALEASFGWPWLTDEMLACELSPQLSNCLKVKRMREARGWAKTNKKDADLLSLLPLEKDDWWKVWMAPPEVRDRRELMRFRADLVAVQTQTKNRIHAILQRHGIFHEFPDLFGGQGRRFLAGLCQEGSEYLGEAAWKALRGQVALLGHVRSQRAWVTGQLRKQLEPTALTRRLATIPGFGLILSHVVAAEIGDIGRFANHKKLAAYSLLAPIATDSGEEDPDRAPLGRRLGKRGNRTLKWAFIEAAHGAVRKGGKWRAMFDRHTEGGKKNRNRGYIKVARELVKVVCPVWAHGTTYQDKAPSRPGRRRGKTRRSSRSGTGQPMPAMVPAK